MALLIDIKHPQWLTDDELRTELLKYDPEADIRIGENPGDPGEIEMLTVSSYLPGEALRYPNLKVIQKTGAGVNNILEDKDLPEAIQVTRLQTSTSGSEMAEYALAYVLQEQRHLCLYHQQQRLSEWTAYPPCKAKETTVTVLGLGRIGSLVAQRFIDNDFRVAGWSRSPKNFSSIDCYSGEDGLAGALACADYVVSVLPSTPKTRGMFNRALFKQFREQAFFINVGRGDQVNEAELMQALDDELLSGAILDVMSVEPLPADNPLWLHPKVQLTPHISGYHLGDAIADIAENYRRLRNNESLLNLVNLEHGY